MHQRFLLLFTLLFSACGNPDDTSQPEESPLFAPRSYDHLGGRSTMKIGFGSCLDQDKSLSIFETVKSAGPDMFLMIGDNVYGDTQDGKLTKMAYAYNKQKGNFRDRELDFPVEAIWDDHDYGLNDAGGDYTHKEASQQLFFDFWEVPKDDVRRTRRGLYREQRLNLNGKTVQILYLDTRYFRGRLSSTDDWGAEGKERYLPTVDTTQTMLGETQWAWLEKTLSSSADFRLIVSSVQFLAAGHGWECWMMMPHERTRMTNLLDELGVDNVLFLSGDRHRGGLYRLTTDGGNTIHEITSSPLNATTYPSTEPGPYRINGPTYTDHNFGLITINAEEGTIMAELVGKDGNSVNNLTVKTGG
ncbi:MAG: phosphatase [Candidatus Marinimicrobia bacterium]|nr:phosphatase [Candidatus Neomarinimicrobiota bacterium]|tara:strand:- start:9321 stop:10397 length:1077 start_codon:yes stop_codon:yes gene_type:complete